MSNPGADLHELYASWRRRIDPSRPTSLMAALEPNSPDGIAEIRRAYALIATIQLLLKRLAVDGHRVAVFQRQLDGWSRVPLALNVHWTTATSPENLISAAMLEQIEGFGAFLDGKVLVLDGPQNENLRSLVDRAEQLLTEDENLDPRLRGYIRRLLFEIRVTLDDEVAGVAFDYTDAVQRLWVAFEAAAAKSKGDEQKQSWMNLAHQIFIGVMTNGAIEAATVGIKAITEG